MQQMKRKPVRSIDGVLPAKAGPTAAAPAAKPAPAYRPPAGPLYLQYLPKPPAPAKKAAPAPRQGPAGPVRLTGPVHQTTILTKPIQPNPAMLGKIKLQPQAPPKPKPSPKPQGISVDGLMPVKQKAAAKPVFNFKRRPDAEKLEALPARIAAPQQPVPGILSAPPQQQPERRAAARHEPARQQQHEERFEIPVADKPKVRDAVKARFSFDKEENTKPISTPLLLGGVALGSLSLFNLQIGEITLAVYAILALWKRWPSRQTFVMALAMFGGIILTSLLEPFRYIAENLAVYAFLLLCIGTLQLAIEVRRDMRAAAKDYR